MIPVHGIIEISTLGGKKTGRSGIFYLDK